MDKGLFIPVIKVGSTYRVKVQDFEDWINEEIQNQDNQSFITEAGDVEKWVGSSKNVLLKQKEDTINFLQSLKKD
jgi:hypothetical protein